MSFPIYAEELELKLERGLEALWNVIAESDLTDVVDPRRPSLLRRG